MNTNRQNDDSASYEAWLNDHLEAYLDGDLSAEETHRVETMLAEHPQWQEELTLAITIRDELRNLPRPACPPQLSAEVLGAVRRDAIQSRVDRINSFLRGIWTLPWQPVLVTMTVVLAVVVFLVSRPAPIPTPGENITQAEVDQALDEIKWTLGYVSKTSRMTGESVQDALAPFLKDLPQEHVQER